MLSPRACAARSIAASHSHRARRRGEREREVPQRPSKRDTRASCSSQACSGQGAPNSRYKRRPKRSRWQGCARGSRKAQQTGHYRTCWPARLAYGCC
eukprot:5128825-Pleurochrysis_carterae.AAC.1